MDDTVSGTYGDGERDDARDRLPWLVAHRGAMREAPENTRAAFDRALSYGPDGVEFDVQLTRDGVPVLYHDRTLARIEGGRKRISDYTYSFLRRKDWGGWFSRAFAGEPILSLEEALQIYGARTRLFIEIKSRARDRLSGGSDTLTRRVLDLLARHIPTAARGDVFILSFDPEVLDLAYREDADWRYVLNVSNPRGRRISGVFSTHAASPCASSAGRSSRKPTTPASG
jgi:glycerophosphoryl diester phosphodiesterase